MYLLLPPDKTNQTIHGITWLFPYRSFHSADLRCQTCRLSSASTKNICCIHPAHRNPPPVFPASAIPHISALRCISYKTKADVFSSMPDTYTIPASDFHTNLQLYSDDLFSASAAAPDPSATPPGAQNPHNILLLSSASFRKAGFQLCST